MVDRLDGQLGSMVNRSDYERLRGFGDGLTDLQMDNFYSRAAFTSDQGLYGNQPQCTAKSLRLHFLRE